MPPPEPRSSTVSPASVAASAVGLPQPSEALDRRPPEFGLCSASYRSRRDRIGAAPHARRCRNRMLLAAAYPQRGLPVLFLHGFFDFVVLMMSSFAAATIVRARPPCSACSTRRTESRAAPAVLRVFAEYRRNVLRALSVTSSSFFSLSRWWESVEPGIPSSLPISPTTIPSGWAESSTA